MPDPAIDPEGYSAVCKFMLHGPCGVADRSAPCMVNGKCSKYFPKQFASHTTVDNNGYVNYRRRDTGIRSNSNDLLDNRFVVLYNRDLLVKYQAHINVLICTHGKLMKYLFKYVHKGLDRARVVITERVSPNTMHEHEPPSDSPHQNSSNSNFSRASLDVTSHISSLYVRPLDEIKSYLDCRYLSAYEAAWRLFDFPIHERNPGIQHLSVHLPGVNVVTFKDNVRIETILENPLSARSTLTEWMLTNKSTPDARHLTYLDFPLEWVWIAKDRVWQRRKQGNTVGQLAHVAPNSGEIYFLRVLLTITKGATCFEDLRTVDGVIYDSFRSACKAHGLLGDDKEWEYAMIDAAMTASGPQMRDLFVIILLFCEVSNCASFFENTFHLMSDDEIYQQRDQNTGVLPEINGSVIRNVVLRLLDAKLHTYSSSLSDFNLPVPNDSESDQLSRNRLLAEELAYDRYQMQSNYARMCSSLNEQQSEIFHSIIAAVDHNRPRPFFVYSSGGTGKTYLYHVIASNLRSRGLIVLTVASSGIASLLLPGGRTAHSRFKIPIDINENFVCFVKKGTQLAELLQKTALIIWDEAPMTHRHCFEALSRMLNDICLDANLNEDIVFGGKIMLLGGDFRQILPVVEEANESATINSCITKSFLWPHFKIFKLSANMRLVSQPQLTSADPELTSFADWLLDVGNGDITMVSFGSEAKPSWIKIPDSLLIPPGADPMQQIFSHTYPNFLSLFSDIMNLKERIIVAPLNDTVDLLNEYILSVIPGEPYTYLSYDSATEDESSAEETEVLYPIEFLNTLKPNCVPDHKLILKKKLPNTAP